MLYNSTRILIFLFLRIVITQPVVQGFSNLECLLNGLYRTTRPTDDLSLIANAFNSNIRLNIPTEATLRNLKFSFHSSL